LYDSVFVCVVNVPLAFALVKLTNLDVTWVYLIANGIEVFKAVLGFVMLRKKIWINKIV
jgi:Na+-driven multidrug efflux pump